MKSDNYSIDRVREMMAANTDGYTIDYRAELNDEQYEAVMFTDGPLLVIAGAGTGKTRTITFRVARLVESGVSPESILLLTFTRKAAKEMLDRAADILDSRCYKIAGGTYHSFATMILRRYAEAVGLKNNFTIADQADSEDIIELIREDLELNKKERRFPKKGTLNSIFSMSVNTCSTIEKVVTNEYPQFINDIHDIEACYNKFVEFKKEKSILDYDDLLVYLNKLLNENPNITKILAERFQYIMVDEYQDSNMLQFSILKALCSVEIEDEWGFLGDGMAMGGSCKRNNICVVGDPSQSIYKFRGAHYKNIINFPNQFENVKTVYLNQNYRSYQEVLDLSNSLMKGANDGLYSPLSSNKSSGKKPCVVTVANDNAQSLFVAQKILESRENGVPLKEMAVLFRSAYHSADLEVTLTKLNIPFKKFGGRKFLDSAHIKDVVGFLKVILNPMDTISWFRVFQTYKNVGLGAKTINKIVRQATDSNQYEFLSTDDIKKAKYGKHLIELQDVLCGLSNKPLDEQLDAVIEYYTPLLYEKYDNEKNREEDIKALADIASKYDNLETFLTDVALDPPEATEVEAEENEDEFVTLSTIHSSKGLEWQSVFILSCIDGYLPSSKSLNTNEDIEEEKRLLYVAVTRAKEDLYIIKANFILRYNGSGVPQISRFFKENPDTRYMVKGVTVR